ncbi:PKD-like family lipoprotein [Sinomicrobium soli]|uniref:PKD-like family lipoprotein n=1 Tax=Sinomicrobium sp. N-1-3-6 TaxID=2219864 RepID=UPI000DCCFB2F|nr:PKD-like family lipoprotein [Sinomicrobium sp. N-1-3-6]RAV28942.1 hypothetical protein DN748_11155 [Sinomicrobium sp. N-1-3-6]
MLQCIKFCLILIGGSLFFWSCAEDLGNYDYIGINEVHFNGFEEQYTAYSGDPFSITPELTFTEDTAGDDEARYTYEWVAFRGGGALPMDQRHELAYTRDLDMDAIALVPGEYELRYKVTDTETGVFWEQLADLHIVTSIYEGWMVLGAVDGTARLDMISKIEGEYTPLYDVLYRSGSALTLEGTPVNVLCYDYDQQFYGIYVTTEGNGTTKIHPETFDWNIEYSLSFEMMANVPTDFGADFIQPMGNGHESMMYKDGDLYYYYRTYQYRYDLPINVMQGETTTFKAAPFIGVGANTLGITLLYDDTHKRFVRQMPYTKGVSVMPEGTLFDYNTGKDLLYMQRTEYNEGEVFALLKDPSGNRVYLARMSSGVYNINQVYYEEVPEAIAADMAAADHFAINPDFGYIFYTVGNKVYEYNFSAKSSKLMLDKGTEEITLLKFDKTAPGSSGENLRNKLVVCSYDTTGTMELYTVPPVQGDLILEESYSGFGKIVSVAYRPR